MLWQGTSSYSTSLEGNAPCWQYAHALIATPVPRSRSFPTLRFHVYAFSFPIECTPLRLYVSKSRLGSLQRSPYLLHLILASSGQWTDAETQGEGRECGGVRS